MPGNSTKSIKDTFNLDNLKLVKILEYIDKNKDRLCKLLIAASLAKEKKEAKSLSADNKEKDFFKILKNLEKENPNKYFLLLIDALSPDETHAKLTTLFKTHPNLLNAFYDFIPDESEQTTEIKIVNKSEKTEEEQIAQISPKTIQSITSECNNLKKELQKKFKEEIAIFPLSELEELGISQDKLEEWLTQYQAPFLTNDKLNIDKVIWHSFKETIGKHLTSSLNQLDDLITKHLAETQSNSDDLKFFIKNNKLEDTISEKTVTFKNLAQQFYLANEISDFALENFKNKNKKDMQKEIEKFNSFLTSNEKILPADLNKKIRECIDAFLKKIKKIPDADQESQKEVSMIAKLPEESQGVNESKKLAKKIRTQMETNENRSETDKPHIISGLKLKR